MERAALGVDAFVKAFSDDASSSRYSCNSVVLPTTGNDKAAAW